LQLLAVHHLNVGYPHVSAQIVVLRTIAMIVAWLVTFSTQPCSPVRANTLLGLHTPLFNLKETRDVSRAMARPLRMNNFHVR
jgi:hypothetical protein